MLEIWEKAIFLERFMRKYVPKGWVVPISNVCFIPYISDKEYEDIEKGVIPKSLDQPYYREAIAEFLKEVENE
jgi:hypothetical protein